MNVQVKASDIAVVAPYWREVEARIAGKELTPLQQAIEQLKKGPCRLTKPQAKAVLRKLTEPMQ